MRKRLQHLSFQFKFYFEDGYIHVISIFIITLWIFLELFSNTVTQKPQIIHTMIKDLAWIQRQWRLGDGQDSLMLAEFWAMGNAYQLDRLGSWEENSKDNWIEKQRPRAWCNDLVTALFCLLIPNILNLNYYVPGYVDRALKKWL